MPELNSGNSIDIYNDPEALSDLIMNDTQIQVKLSDIIEKLGISQLMGGLV